MRSGMFIEQFTCGAVTITPQRMSGKNYFAIDFPLFMSGVPLSSRAKPGTHTPPTVASELHLGG
jgi:hypothetical protein